MPVWQLDQRLLFPDPSMADPDGLLAIGGDLSQERLVLAYRSGIFPWFTHDDEPFWFSPDPRCVLLFDALKISASMGSLMKKHAFRVTVDHDFQQVITQCASIPRKHDDDTWIDGHFMEAYTSLHHSGIAHSVEAWENDQLAGGLYGLTLGSCFFGESMFSRKSNASKYAFIHLVQHLQASGYSFIDCQIYNTHLASLGAKNITRDAYLHMLSDALKNQPQVKLQACVLDQGANLRINQLPAGS